MEGGCMNRLIFAAGNGLILNPLKLLKRLPPDSHYSTDWLDVEGSRSLPSSRLRVRIFAVEEMDGEDDQGGIWISLCISACRLLQPGKYWFCACDFEWAAADELVLGSKRADDDELSAFRLECAAVR